MRIDIHPKGKPFEASTHVHAVEKPFAVLCIETGNCDLTIYAAPDDAVKLIRIATLLNEVFADVKEAAE